MQCSAIPAANRGKRRAWSPRPCTTAKVMAAPDCGQARYASFVPSADSIEVAPVTTPSGTKVPEAPKNLERLLLCLEQRRGIGADAAKRVGPFGAGRALRMKSKCRWIEEDALALDLLDHRSFGKHVLERLARRQTACLKLQPPELGERVILVYHGRRDGVFRAEVPHKDRDDQSVGLISCHLHEARSADISLVVSKVSVVLHLEKAARVRAGDPGWIATSGACGGKCLELVVDALEALLGKPV